MLCKCFLKIEVRSALWKDMLDCHLANFANINITFLQEFMSEFWWNMFSSITLYVSTFDLCNTFPIILMQ